MKRRAKRSKSSNSNSSARADDRLLSQQDDFDALLEEIREAGHVGFDTEFVSDQTYAPVLCLLQISVGKKLVAVDTLEGLDLSGWWEIVADEETTVVAHGSQAEIRFCLDATGGPPRNFHDVQVAEGLLGRSYPLSYTNLVSRVLGKRTTGKQTRTDWTRRPLSDKQLEYALEDVVHLTPIWRKQRKSLEKLGRLEWAESEILRFVGDVVAEREREPWKRLSGLNKLSRRDIAVVREMAAWREETARTRDKLPRRILRDDLLIDIARRHPTTEAELLETRDMNRSSYRRDAEEMLEAVQRGLDTPESKLPKRTAPRGRSRQQNEDEEVIGKLLGLALANRCGELGVAMSLVGTNNDLRDLVRWHLDGDKGDLPKLMQGWREEVCGDLLVDVLDGRIAMRVADVSSDHPLVFERRD